MLKEDNDVIHSRYHYEAFGLHIASDVLLPEFLPAIDPSVEPEVRIGLGEVPYGISDATERNEVYQVAKNEFLLRVKGVGGYYVTNGNCIVVEPEGRSEDFVRLFLLGTAFGSLLLQRGIVPIHGSAVVFDGYCVVFTGASGAGKSTLSAAFRERGYSILTDDVAAVIVKEDGVAVVQPGFPQQRLHRDSMEAVGLDVTNRWLLDSRDEEFTVPVHTGFCQSAVPLGAIYELAVGTFPPVAISRLSIMEKITALTNNTWFRLIDGLGLKTEHLRNCLGIAGIVPVSRLTRPDGVFSLQEQMRRVEEDLYTNSQSTYYERRILC